MSPPFRTFSLTPAAPPRPPACLRWTPDAYYLFARRNTRPAEATPSADDFVERSGAARHDFSSLLMKPVDAVVAV